LEVSARGIIQEIIPYIYRGAEEMHKERQSGKRPGRESNRESPTCKSETLQLEPPGQVPLL